MQSWPNFDDDADDDDDDDDKRSETVSHNLYISTRRR
jgi:hypothetical protein